LHWHTVLLAARHAVVCVCVVESHEPHVEGQAEDVAVAEVEGVVAAALYLPAPQAVQVRSCVGVAACA